MSYSIYYQARVQRAKTWFLTAILKSYPNLVFDRTIEKKEGIFEFYVAPDLEAEFLELMSYFEAEGIVADLNKLPNRLLNPDEIVDKGIRR